MMIIVEAQVYIGVESKKYDIETDAQVTHDMDMDARLPT